MFYKISIKHKYFNNGDGRVIIRLTFKYKFVLINNSYPRPIPFFSTNRN